MLDAHYTMPRARAHARMARAACAHSDRAHVRMPRAYGCSYARRAHARPCWAGRLEIGVGQLGHLTRSQREMAAMPVRAVRQNEENFGTWPNACEHSGARLPVRSLPVCAWPALALGVWEKTGFSGCMRRMHTIRPRAAAGRGAVVCAPLAQLQLGQATPAAGLACRLWPGCRPGCLGAAPAASGCLPAFYLDLDLPPCACPPAVKLMAACMFV